MKTALLGSALLLLWNHSPAFAAPDLYRCHDQRSYSFCVPSIGQGERLLGVSRNANELSAEIRGSLRGIADRRGTVQPLSARSPGEQALSRDFSDRSVSDIGSFFPPFVRASFNRQAGFGGPNCYHSALVSSGMLDPREIRYVGRGEFELYLSNFFTRVTEPLPGDIVVFNARSSRDHAAFYLFNGLVFHKKGFQNGYGYRIVDINGVNQKEWNEWEPPLMMALRSERPLQGFPADGAMFYRRRPNPPALGRPAHERESQQLRILDYLSAEVLRQAPKWALGEVQGLIVEELMSDLLTEFGALANSASLLSRLGLERASSFRYQLFQGIEETHFSSRYASAMRDKINEKICVNYNQHLNQVIQLLLGYYGKPADDRAVAAILAQVRTYDRKACRIPLLEIVKRS